VTVVEEIRPRPSRSAPARRLAATWPAIWVAVLGGLAVLSMVAMLPLSLLAREFGSGIVAVVIGIPCAGVAERTLRRFPAQPPPGPVRAARQPPTLVASARMPIIRSTASRASGPAARTVTC
jgi:hypothetical protein